MLASGLRLACSLLARLLSAIVEQYDDRPIRFRTDLEAMIRQDRLGDALVLLLAQQCRIDRVGGLSPTLDARLLASLEGFKPLLSTASACPVAARVEGKGWD